MMIYVVKCTFLMINFPPFFRNPPPRPSPNPEAQPAQEKQQQNQNTVLPIIINTKTLSTR